MAAGPCRAAPSNLPRTLSGPLIGGLAVRNKYKCMRRGSNRRAFVFQLVLLRFLHRGYLLTPAKLRDRDRNSINGYSSIWTARDGCASTVTGAEFTADCFSKKNISVCGLPQTYGGSNGSSTLPTHTRSATLGHLSCAKFASSAG